jgi:hypothetical protein
MTNDAARAGSAKTIITDVTRAIQTNSGTSRIVMPGARSVTTVTARLIAEPTLLPAIISSASAQ